MSKPCEWCSNTSSTIDSMEYQIEQLQRERDALKAKCAEFANLLCDITAEPISNETRHEISNLLIRNPDNCLAEIKAREVRSFGEEIGLYDSAYDDHEYIEVRRYDLKNHVDNLLQQAGISK